MGAQKAPNRLGLRRNAEAEALAAVLGIVATAPSELAVRVEYRPEWRVGKRPATLAGRRTSQGQRSSETLRECRPSGGPKEIVGLGRGELVEGAHRVGDLSLQITRGLSAEWLTK